MMEGRSLFYMSRMDMVTEHIAKCGTNTLMLRISILTDFIHQYHLFSVSSLLPIFADRPGTVDIQVPWGCEGGAHSMH